MNLSQISAALVQFPPAVEYFQGIFLLLDTLCQPVISQHGKKWLNIPSMALTQTTCRDRDRRLLPTFAHRQPMAEK